MSTDQILVLTILAATVAMFLWGRWRHDMVAAGALLACVITGLVAPADAFAGFGHPAVITVACVLVLSRGLQTSGAVDVLARTVLPARAGPTLGIGALVVLAALLSGFMNNVGALALLMPVAIQLAARLELPPGKVLMPLAFGSILGGMTTLIGTPPNLIVAGFRQQLPGREGFGMFDYTAVGAPVALLGALFIVLVGWRIVPARKQSGAECFETGAYITEARVAEGSKSAGRSLREVEASLDEIGAQVIGLVRNATRIVAPHPRRKLREGDILVVEAEAEALAKMLSELGLKLEEAVEPKRTDGDEQAEPGADEGGARDDGSKGEEGDTGATGQKVGKAESDEQAEKGEQAERGEQAKKGEPAKKDDKGEKDAKGKQGRSDDGSDDEEAKPEKDEKAADAGDLVLVELAVLPASVLVGRSASDILLRTRYGLNLLAVSRQGQRSMVRLRSLALRAGDLLLMQGAQESIAEFASDNGCVPLAERELRIPDRRKAITAALVMLASVGVAAFGLLPAATAFLAGVLASMALRTVPPRAVYDAVDWPVIVLLAALIPVAGAMESSGAADLVARVLLEGVAQGHAVGALVLILVVTMFLSDVMNNAATAAVMCPIAIGTASALGASADAFLMAVAIGASCAFLTPIGHQNNTLILGPGGFRFGDYWRLGLPLELLVIAVAVPPLLVVWPL